MPKPEPKNIIVLSDGTGNSSAQIFRTNVWRTYEALDLSDPTKQIAYYDDGVGTSMVKPLALVTGAIGFGLSRNVRQLYAFLCRNYNPGDRIYGFGFSRGAFTIRILAGFVTAIGLLKREAFAGERDLKKKTTWLYRVYRKQCSGDGMVPLLAVVFRFLRDQWPKQAMDSKTRTHSLHHPVKIRFLGLWDTVDAYGSPVEEMTRGWDNMVWPLSMREQNLSMDVEKAVHALCLDDERNSFHPLLWNEEKEKAISAETREEIPFTEAKNIREERLTQVWFAGMHSNVGGGYADDFLSYVPLNFVLDQLDEGVLLNKVKRQAYRDAARVEGVMHDSRKGLQSYYRLLPRKLEKILDTSRKRLKWSGPTVVKRIDANVVRVARPKIHHSVFDRIKAEDTTYAPIVLPAFYAEVDANGVINEPDASTFETSGKAEARAKAQERVWDFVWCRRVTYFATLFFTLLLAALPWLKSLPSLSASGLTSIMLDDGKCIDSAFCFLAGIPKLLGAFLPAFASTWVDTFSANPGIFGLLAGIIILLMYIGKRLDARIHDRMKAMWRPSAALDTTYSRLHDFRESKPYQWTLRRLKKYVLPFLFGTATLASLFIIVLSGASRIIFSFADATGLYCISDGNIHLDAISRTYSARREFDPKKPCWRAGLLAEEGATYRVVLNIAGATEEWNDGGLRADLTGNLVSHGPLIAVTAWPAKRYVWENYYKPIVRIRKIVTGAAGQDEYVLNPTFKAKLQYDCLVSDFTAESSGEFYMFVNDAIIYFRPNQWFPTYENNGGEAELFVKRIARIGEPFALPPDMKDTSACKEFVFAPP